MKTTSATLSGLTLISSALLLSTGGPSVAEGYTRHSMYYQSRYGDVRADYGARYSYYPSGYAGQAAYSYAPGWRSYSGSSDDQCNLPPSSLDYAPCSQF